MNVPERPDFIPISRVRAKSRTLTLEDAVAIHRRRALGEAQHEIAAALKVNQGRISEILTLKRYPEAASIARGSGSDRRPV